MKNLRPDDVRDRITAGKRDRKIEVHRATYTRNAVGELIETWSRQFSAWASWRRASAREQLAAAEVSASVTDVFGLPWSRKVSGITPMDRIVFGGRTYDIAESTELGFREGWIIRASARAESMTVEDDS